MNLIGVYISLLDIPLFTWTSLAERFSGFSAWRCGLRVQPSVTVA